MPAVASTSTILPSGDPLAQASAAFTIIDAELQAAGFRPIRTFTPTVPPFPNRLYRYPAVDGHDTRPDLLCMFASQYGVTFAGVYDMNVQTADTDPTLALGAAGNFTGGTWPGSGAPALYGIGVVFAGAYTTFNVDALTTNTLRTVASIAGVVAHAAYGPTGQGGGAERPLDMARGGRNIGFSGTPTAAYPLTFAAPTGGVAHHLRIRVEGTDYDVDFPTATPLSAFRICQEITRQTEGVAEAVVRTLANGDETISIRIPPDRAPIANVSTEDAQIALVYQDPTVPAAGLEFQRAGRSASYYTVGTNTLSRTGFSFPLEQIRIGATVRNHTQNASTTVTGFSAPDTADLVSTMGWSSSDIIEVYPGPETTSHGYGQHGGQWQAVREGAETSDIAAGAPVTLVLSDVLGEAKDQYEVGQAVLLVNNGACVTLTLSGVTGTFAYGEEVTFSATGAKGRVRGIAGSDYAVDVTEGPSGGGVPVTASGTMTGATSGASGTVSAVEAFSNTRTGWSTIALITAIDTVDAPNGDFRTTLTVDLTTVNASFVVGPGAVVGATAKIQVIYDMTGATGWAGPVAVPFISLADVSRNQDYLGAPTPAVEPNWETHSLELAELGTRSDTTVVNRNHFVPFAHTRSVSARNGTVQRGDMILEDQDPDRAWVAVQRITPGTAFGAASASAPTIWLVLGPGGTP